MDYDHTWDECSAARQPCSWHHWCPGCNCFTPNAHDHRAIVLAAAEEYEHMAKTCGADERWHNGELASVVLMRGAMKMRGNPDSPASADMAKLIFRGNDDDSPK